MKLGTNDIGSVYLGTNAVQKVYLGTNEVWSSYAYLLDDYSGADAAYSLRLLRADYTGDAIEVRRASDNSTQDIGFVNNELDVTSLESFCSGTNGFVTTWYDQSGNGYDATQSTASAQPQIVSSGSVILENGKPAVDFDGSDDYLLTGSTVVTSQQGFVFATFNSENGQFGLAQSNSATNLDAFKLDDSASTSSPKYIRFLQLSSTVSFATGSSDIYNNQTLATYSSDSTAWAAWVNSISQTLTVGGGTNNGSWFGDHQFPLAIQLLQRPTPLYFASIIQEIVIYNSDQSSNRTGIETNINDFYSIY